MNQDFTDRNDIISTVTGCDGFLQKVCYWGCSYRGYEKTRHNSSPTLQISKKPVTRGCFAELKAKIVR